MTIETNDRPGLLVRSPPLEQAHNPARLLAAACTPWLHRSPTTALRIPLTRVI